MSNKVSRIWLFLMLVLVLAGCPAPGKGRKAKLAYAIAAPVITALKKYHNATGGYPKSLDVLVPKYLAELPKDFSADEMIDGIASDKGLGYRKTDKSYEIGFTYYGPGINRCTYTPESGWTAFRYY